MWVIQWEKFCWRETLAVIGVSYVAEYVFFAENNGLHGMEWLTEIGPIVVNHSEDYVLVGEVAPLFVHLLGMHGRNRIGQNVGPGGKQYNIRMYWWNGHDFTLSHI